MSGLHCLLIGQCGNSRTDYWRYQPEIFLFLFLFRKRLHSYVEYYVFGGGLEKGKEETIERKTANRKEE